MTGRVSAAEISADLGARAECFCRAYFPDGQRQGNYWQVGDTSGAAGRSLVIRLHAHDGRKAGGWTDYATGEFGAKLGSRSLRETLHEAQQFLGNAPLLVQQVSKTVSWDAGAANVKRIGSARGLFAAGKPVFGTAAAAYLHRRAVARFGPALRFHPRVYLRGDDIDSNHGQSGQHYGMCSDISRSDEWQDCRTAQSETVTGPASRQRCSVLVRVQSRPFDRRRRS